MSARASKVGRTWKPEFARVNWESNSRGRNALKNEAKKRGRKGRLRMGRAWKDIGVV